MKYLCLLLALSGCALLSKADPLAPKYYTPETIPAAAAGTKKPLSLRLGAITSGASIKTLFAHRNSEFELAYDETARWSERPEVYLRRSLSRALFEQRGVQRVVSGPSKTLEIEVLAFEEVRSAPNRFRITLLMLLFDDRTTLIEETVTFEENIPAKHDVHADDVVRASSTALERAVNRVADRATAALEASP